MDFRTEKLDTKSVLENKIAILKIFLLIVLFYSELDLKMMVE